MNGRTAMEGFSAVMKVCYRGRDRNAIDPHRPSDVLYSLLSKIFETQTKFFLNLIKSCPRDTNTSSLCETLDSSRNIDAISVNIITLLNHITQIDSYAKLHPSVLWQLTISSLEFLLNLHCTLDRIHYATKLGQQTIPRNIYDATIKMLNEVSHHIPISGQVLKGCNLILTHEAAVSLDICTQDGSEFAFNFLGGHGIPQRLIVRLV